MVKNLTTIKERVLHFAKHEGIAIATFLASIDMTYGSFKGQAKQRSLNSDAIAKILTKYPSLNPVWLLTGEGQMLLAVESQDKNDLSTDQKFNQRILITPLISKYSQQAFIENFNNESFVERLNKVPWINNFEMDSAMFKTFEVKGDKMDDNSPNSFLDGDLILTIELNFESWPDFKKTKSCYVVLHRTLGVLICRILAFDKSSGILFCHYLNDFYQDFEVDKSDVLTIYRIVELRREPRF